MPDVKIGDRITFANSFILKDVSNLRCSWEISRIGLMSFDVPLADLPPAAAFPQLLLRKWIEYKHPTAGTWGGVIQNISVADGIVTIDSESWATMMRGVYTSGITASTISAGLQQAISSVSALTGITYGSFANPGQSDPDYYITAEVSPGTEFFQNGQDLFDSFLQAAMDQLMNDSGWRSSLRTVAWNIDPDTRVFSLDMNYGRILTNTVALWDGLHTVSSRWSDNLEDIANRVWLTASYNRIWNKPIQHDPVWTVLTNDVPAYCTKAASTPGKCKKKKGQWIPAVAGTGRWDPVPDTYEPTTVKEGPTTVQGYDTDSVNRYGPINVSISQDKVYATADEFQAGAHVLAKALARNEQLITLDTVDEDGIWSLFREGDVIRVEMTNTGRRGNMMVRTRALDTTRETLVIAGEANLQ